MMRWLFACLIFLISANLYGNTFALGLKGEETTCKKVFTARNTEQQPNNLYFQVTADEMTTNFSMRILALKGSGPFKDAMFGAYQNTLKLFNLGTDDPLADEPGIFPREDEFMSIHRSGDRHLYLQFYNDYGPEEGTAVEAVFILGTWEDFIQNRPVIFKFTDDGLNQWQSYVTNYQNGSVKEITHTFAYAFTDTNLRAKANQKVETVVQEAVIFEGTRNKLDMVSSDNTKWSVELKFKN